MSNNKINNKKTFTEKAEKLYNERQASFLERWILELDTTNPEDNAIFCRVVNAINKHLSERHLCSHCNTWINFNKNLFKECLCPNCNTLINFNK